MRHISHVVEIHELGYIAVFNATFSAHILMLVMVIFAVLSEAYRGKSLLVKRNVIPAAKVAVEAEDQHRLQAYFIGTCDFCDVAGDLARWGIALSSEIADEL